MTNELERITEENNRLKAQLAMQANLLNTLEDDGLTPWQVKTLEKALNATAEDVAKYKAEIEKSVLEEVADYADESHFRTLPSSEIRRIAEERGGVR